MALCVLKIDIVGNEIEVTIESENAEGLDPRDPQDQEGRRRSFRGNSGQRRKDYFAHQRQTRELPTRKHPDLMGPHIPIFLLELPNNHEDKIVWKCASPFVVDVEMDTGYGPDPNAPANSNPPRSPMANSRGELWSTPQASQLVNDPQSPYNGSHVVQAVYSKVTHAKHHIFYKCTIWCNGLKYDPDFYCDAGP
jgi:hypothetical protein